MATKIRYIDDEQGNHVFPVTHERAVIDGNGTLLETKLASFITSAVSNLANYYLKAETYSKEEVQALLSSIQQFSYRVVQTLPPPSAATMGKIYLVNSGSPKPPTNIKDEYITIETSGVYSWEQIGSTAIDLTGYVTTEALATALEDKQDVLVSGTNLKMINNESLLGSGSVTIADGKSAYQSWLDAGNSGTEAEFLDSLRGMGFEAVSTQQDGTMVITLTNGDTITVDLNHNHPQYLKYVLLEDESEMPSDPDDDTLYLIPVEE